MSETQDQGLVYRTVQKAPGLTGRHVGPLFTSEEEAKRAVEHFVETEQSATPTEWHEEDGRLRMTPSATRSEFFVDRVPVRESLDELIDEPNVEDGEEVKGLAD
jgi:hypothetical protein